MTRRCHQMPFGAEVLSRGAVHFRLWAPAADRISLVLYGEEGESLHAMKRCGDGWYELVTEMARHGSRYHYQLDDGLRIPDPASRYQPEDVHGPSEVIDPSRWQWDDADWHGRPWQEAVFYELHVGTFTESGDYAGIESRLDYLQQLGITALQLMPLGDFPGRFDWGYNGVLLFAPESRYGTPDELKRLITAAHRRGLMIFLDVVYNHFGPEGNYLHLYAPHFFHRDAGHAWGEAINLDGPQSEWVRRFFIHNACYWIEEYGVDGLRLDAVHALRDNSPTSFLQELAVTVQHTIGQGRQVHLVLENDDNTAQLLTRESNGIPRYYVAQWNDDLHHAMHCLLSGEHSGYYSDYRNDSAHDAARGLAEGFVYQGARSHYRQRSRGETSSELPPIAFVNFLQNHDQVGNRPGAERLLQLTTPEALRAATAILLLHPAPPLIFMGQEWGSCQPFTFFCDLSPEYAGQAVVGRARELAQLLDLEPLTVSTLMHDPTQEATFLLAVLHWQESEGAGGRAWHALHRHLLELRRVEITPHLDRLSSCGEFLLYTPTLLECRWPLEEGAQLILRANLAAHSAGPLPPPSGRLLFASEWTVALGQWPAWSVGWWKGQLP